MIWLLWLGVIVLLVGLVWLQFRGVKAMKELGVAQPKIIIVMKAVNVVLVMGVVGWALWQWVI